MSDLHERTRKVRHTVEAALALSFIAGVFDFIVGIRSLTIIMGAAWLTCFAIYVKMRRLERSIR